jgi:hypothetical protein
MGHGLSREFLDHLKGPFEFVLGHLWELHGRHAGAPVWVLETGVSTSHRQVVVLDPDPAYFALALPSSLLAYRRSWRISTKALTSLPSRALPPWGFNVQGSPTLTERHRKLPERDINIRMPERRAIGPIWRQENREAGTMEARGVRVRSFR